MANYVLDPDGVVENLRSLLRDQYVPRSIFKELVQNADDAQANTLYLAQHGGFADHPNPLLRVPALVVVNNGPFLPKDARAFKSIGIGSKGGDDLAIGKFGRGLKSIFHICEAFFYFGSDDQVGLQGAEYSSPPNPGLLNPWEGTAYHTDWTCDTAVTTLLKDEVSIWLHEIPSWFCLWIPLKCDALLNDIAPIVEPRVCTVEEILTDFPRNAAELLPLLQNLQTVAYWQSFDAYNFSISLDEGAQRPRYPTDTDNRQDGISSERIWGSVACINGLGQRQDYSYCGQEVLSQDPIFDQLRNSPEWPKVSVRDHKTGASTQEPDKTRPHAAVVFQQLPSSGQSTHALRISRNVFLPLTDSESTQQISQAARSYRLHLHGCYFVDAGRRDVVLSAGEVPNEYIDPHKRLAGDWNRTLEQQALLPLVLPTLQDFATTLSLSSSEIHGLTEALSCSERLAGERAVLCRQKHWMARLTLQGIESQSWQLLPSEQPYYILPMPPKEQFSLLFEVLPELVTLCQGSAITFAELPRMTHVPPASWQPLLPTLLKSIPVNEVFRQKEMLDYLTTFLEATQADSVPHMEGAEIGVQAVTESWHSVLSGKIREAFQECGVKALRLHTESVRRLFALIPSDAVVLLSDSVPYKTLDALAALPTTPLLVPLDLWPELEQKANGFFSPAEATKVLAWLETAEITLKWRSEIALTILAKTTGTMDEQIAMCGALKLFDVWEQAAEKAICASWRQIRSWQAAGMFVANQLGSNRVLTLALDHPELYRPKELTNSRIPETLLRDIPIEALYCNLDFCVKVLHRSPPLSAPEYRKSLLKELLGKLSGGDDNDLRRAIRYLLHGNADAFELSGLPLYRSTEQTKIWAEIVQRTLTAKGQTWQLIPGQLSVFLEPYQQALGLIVIDAGSAERLLREAGVNCLQGWYPDTDTREAILQAISVSDNDFWRTLPLHLTSSGDLMPIHDANCYLRGHKNPPESLASAVRIIDCLIGSPIRQRYSQCGISPWDSLGVIRTALHLQDPSVYCLDILEALDTLKDSIASSEDTVRDLKQNRWLAARQASIAPHQIHNLTGMENILSNILERPGLQGRFYAVEILAEAIRQHPGFTVVREQLLPSRMKTIRQIGNAIRPLPDYTIGDPTIENPDAEAILQFLNAFSGVDLARFPGLQLLNGVAQQQDLRTELPSLYAALHKPLTIAEYRLFFAALKRGYSEENGPKVYNAYFRTLVRRPKFCRADLTDLPLRDERANWKTADRLCEDVSGIALSDRLRGDLLEILRTEEKQQTSFGLYEEIAEIGRPPVVSEQATVLERYFADWIGAGCRQEVIGLFLAFLSTQPDIEELAQKYLGSHYSVDRLRQLLHWKAIDKKLPETSRQDIALWDARAQRELAGYGDFYSKRGETLDDAFDRRFFKFMPEDEQTDGKIEVTNLLGGRFLARRNDNPDSLFLGEPEFSRIQGAMGGVQLCLRRIDVRQMQRNQMRDLIYKASHQILREVYAQDPEVLSDLFTQMSQSEQLDIEATQRSILNMAFVYFRLLDTSKQNKIRTLAKEWINLDYEEEIESKATGKTSGVDSLRADKRNRLRNLLESDPGVQEEIREAVRGKITQQQYTVQSVLFELFQNADDAVNEKQIMFGDYVPNPDLARRVVLQWNENEVNWIHWGRAINRSRGGKCSEEQGIDQGFHTDLWKMLVLSASDKKENTTGKFGLGFKSIFLLSDEPALISNDLSCSIVAGMYPKKLDGETFARLQSALGKATDPDMREAGTLINIPFRQHINAQEVVAEFLNLAYLLPIFARCVRRIDLFANGVREFVKWKPDRLGTDLSVETELTVGELFPTSQARHNGHVNSRALVLRPKRETHGLLFAVGPYGIEPLHETVPTYWVTMPARGSEKGAGIAVNANFEVDPGRVQLANKEENLVVAKNLGVQLNQAFASLYKASLEWAEFRSRLHLAVEVTDVSFWTSLFNQTVLPFQSGTEHRILGKVLWTPGGGMAEFLTSSPVLPTELPGKYARLTCLPNVRWQIVGLLERPKIFKQVSVWNGFTQRYMAGQIVSSSRIAMLLQRVGALAEIQSLSLKDVLDLPKDDRIVALQAARLGTVLTSEFLASGEGTEDTNKEREEKTALRERLRELQFPTAQFPTAQGQYVPSRDLLLWSSPTAKSDEESKRAAFCPDANRLAYDFNGTALEFFKACRGTMYAPADRLINWGVQIDNKDTERQKAFLEYLLTGELSGSMSINSARRDGCWLGTLPASPLFTEFSENQQMGLLWRLGIGKQDVMDRKHSPEPPTKLAIVKIAEWWRKNRGEQIDVYRNKLYPDGGDFLRNLSSPYCRTLSEQSAWMTLLLRSSLETMGRAKIEQHKGFLSKYANDWVQNFVTSTSRGEALYEDLCRFMDRKTYNDTYLHWIKYYTPIAVYANWLDDIVEIILQLNKIEDTEIKQGLHGFLRPGSNSYLHGSDMYAPDLTPLLGLGRHFLVRELYRCRVLTNPVLLPYCFMPTAKIRRLMQGCGMEDASDSQQIYLFLQTELQEEAEWFCRDGDIPLQIIASDPKLWATFLPSVEYIDETDDSEE